MSHFGKFFFRNFASVEVRALLEYIVPAAVIKILSIDVERPIAFAFEITLKHVSNCIVSHINSRVTQRFNLELLIPWEEST